MSHTGAYFRKYTASSIFPSYHYINYFFLVFAMSLHLSPILWYSVILSIQHIAYFSHTCPFPTTPILTWSGDTLIKKAVICGEARTLHFGLGWPARQLRVGVRRRLNFCVRGCVRAALTYTQWTNEIRKGKFHQFITLRMLKFSLHFENSYFETILLGLGQMRMNDEQFFLHSVCTSYKFNQTHSKFYFGTDKISFNFRIEHVG